MYGNIILMVQSYDINEKMKVRFELKYPQYEFHWHYGFQSSIKNALTFVENDSVMKQNIIQNQKLNEGFIDEIQFLLALDHSVNKKVSMDEALKVLGLKYNHNSIMINHYSKG